MIRTFMRRSLITPTVFLALVGGSLTSMPASTLASSHREAPLITEMPKVDSTDLYVFNSYEAGREGYVTIIANYQPFQAPFGGPNFYPLDPDALYEIHVDNTGDGKEDITFQFRFENTLQNLSVPVGGKNIPVPLINLGPISGPNAPTLNVAETYTLDIVRGGRRSGSRQSVASTGGGKFTKPTDNIGQKSIPNYDTYARSFIHPFTMPGCDAGQGRVFVGQRKDPFFVNISEAFDLLNLNPVGPTDAKRNNLKDFNVTSIAMEIPASCLCRNGQNKAIGVWQTSSLRQARILRPRPTFNNPTVEGGAWTQVSRLGMPFVNELFIGLPDKDQFNASKPVDDIQFADYVTNPSLPIIIQTLFPSVTAPNQYPRTDLVAVFLTGVPNVNQVSLNPTPSEMMRLNTSIPATPAAQQSPLGAALCFVNGALTLTNPGCDPAGFPNGRRPGDDIVDIELRVAMGYLLPTGAPSGQLPFTDQVAGSAALFDTQFPYIRTPIPGGPQNVTSPVNQ